MRKKKLREVRDPYEMYMLVFQECMEVSTMPNSNEDKYKRYDVPGEQAKAAVALGIAHAAYAKEYPIEMATKPIVPWPFMQFHKYINETFKGFKNAAREN